MALSEDGKPVGGAEKQDRLKLRVCEIEVVPRHRVTVSRNRRTLTDMDMLITGWEMGEECTKGWSFEA